MSRQRRHSFWHNERGGVAIFFGFALPVLLVGAGAAMEYSSLAARRTQLQKAADTAALAAANELKIAGLFIGANAKVTLNPGIYVIKDGPLKIDSNAEVYGRNVGFHFIGNNAHFEFTSNAKVNIGAPKDGPMAGILFYGDPNASNDRTYKITSNYANHLIGTLYLPRGRFVIDASSPVADQSAWTALIANQIELYAQPNLVLNSNYDQSDVPVPQGLIQKGDARLAN